MLSPVEVRLFVFLFSSRRRHTRCALVTGVQTCALPISLVLPIAVVILVALFLIQSGGTARVGALFGPIVLVYFATLATLGVANIAAHPEIVGVINPYWAFEFFRYDTQLAFLAMGSVFLAVTGAETLYAELGHFGRKAG